MALKWTDEQQAIFDSHGKNVLVSASAGSGKTTVMISKIIDLVLKENDRTPISNFLVVTFTKASAEDMKAKLIEAFSNHQDDEFCLKQMDDVEISDISNLHSFCSRLISTYFYEVNVDPSFQVLDGVHASFLQDKALDKLFERKEKQGDLNYFKLFEIFQKKRQNKPLKNIIKRFNNFLNASLDENKWFQETLESAYNIDLSQNSCANIINNYVSSQMKKLSQEAERLAGLCLECNQEKLHAYFSEVSSCLMSVNSRNSFEINSKNILQIKLPIAPRLSLDVNLKGQVDELKDRIRKQVENFQNNFITDDIEYLKSGLLASREIVIALYDMVKEFNEIYDEMKKEINSLDFNDLEKMALQILKNPQIIDALRKKYRYIFVDEYQDINSVQEEIISLVSGANNRFMVGDIKQSIYRFRLCDPDIFLDKYEKYSKKNDNSELFKLNCNFRSDKKILKFVDLIFSGVMTEDFGGIDYKKDSCFVPGDGNLDQEDSVNVFFVDTTKEKAKDEEVEGVYSVKNHRQSILDDEEKGVVEGLIVAETIADLIKKDGDKFNYSDVAVLVGSRNAMVMKFIETLRKCGIKVSSDEKYNLVEKVYIQEILNFVKFVCNRNNDFYLFKVLKSRLFGFTDDDLVKIRLLDPKIRFYECLKNSNNIKDEGLREKLINFNKKIELYSKIARVLNIKQFCKKIIEDFSLYQINAASEDADKANYNIDLMVNALPDTDVFDFVLNYENFSLEVENECGGDTVSVMTIHKSKGLDYKYVFLINTTNEFNFESTYDSVIFNKQYGVGLDYFDLESRIQMPTIASSGIKLLEKRKLVEEQQRVLYVALTRAKEKLFVICSKDEDKLSQKNIEHKKCFADWFEPLIYKELNGKHNPLINFKKLDSSDFVQDFDNDSRSILFRDEEMEKPTWYQYPYSQAGQFRLKTSISKIIKDDKKETEHYVGSGSSADRGTTYHEFLQNLNLKADNLDNEIYRLASEEKWKVNIDLNLIKNLLKLPIFNEISRAKYILTEREFYARLSTDEIKQSNASGKFILQGIIDLIAVFDEGLIILDYKTGRMNHEKLKDYTFQLNIYSSIAEKIYGKKVIKKVLCMIDEQKIIEI